jgi:hypothetical protein
MDDSEDNIDHTLYIFNTNATNESLSELAHLPNDSRPDEIGKPNEDLYGVRFLGNRAYFVTFERIDPLYVIDMTDSSDPYIAGALDIPGVSNFLHPINDKLLLGLGQSAERQVKLSLFDVSDINLPMLRSELIVAPELQWTNSEAEYDRHAFTYLAGENDDKFAIPVSGWDETAQQQRQQLHLFNLLGKSDAASASLSEQGVMEVNNLTEGEYPDYRNRAILHDDTIYYINGSRVYSAFWTSPQDQLGPQ